jgi:hypothetical protein
MESEELAYEVEAAVIDALRLAGAELTNLAGGHGANQTVGSRAAGVGHARRNRRAIDHTAKSPQHAKLRAAEQPQSVLLMTIAFSV